MKLQTVHISTEQKQNGWTRSQCCLKYSFSFKIRPKYSFPVSSGGGVTAEQTIDYCVHPMNLRSDQTDYLEYSGDFTATKAMIL